MVVVVVMVTMMVMMMMTMVVVVVMVTLTLLLLVPLVWQEPRLFAGTIAENIEYGKPGASRAQVEAAARAANAHDFIQSFPAGYDTDVGSAGAQLSGQGQGLIGWL